MLQDARYRYLRLASLDEGLARVAGDRKVAALRLEPGPWRGSAAGGFLLAEGVLAQATLLRGQRSVVLVHPGDVVLQASRDLFARPEARSWRVLTPGVAIALDAALIETGAPELLQRLAAQHARAVALLAIAHRPRVEDRLLGVLGLLAEQFGKVGSDGIRIDAFLTHQGLGELIGARRSTVTLAFTRLRELGLAEAGNGHWRVAFEALEHLEGVGAHTRDLLDRSAAIHPQAAQAVRLLRGL